MEYLRKQIEQLKRGNAWLQTKVEEAEKVSDDHEVYSYDNIGQLITQLKTNVMYNNMVIEICEYYLSKVDPAVVYKNGKYHISDGRHRIKALANSGYEYIELPVLREMLLEDNDDNNSGEEEIKLTSHLNYPDMVYDYVFRVSLGRDTLAARFTKRDCKDNVDGYPFTAAWTNLNLKGGSQLSFLTSADVEEFFLSTHMSFNKSWSKNTYISRSKQKVVRIDVNGAVPCYVGVDYLNSTYGDKEGYIHPVIQKRLDEATPTANTIAKNVDKETIDKKKTTSRNKINDVVIECLENLKRLTESVNGEVLAGLVTELDFPDHPEYWTMDFDQLWDVFVKNYSRDDLTKKALDDNSAEDNKLSDDYVEGYNRLIDDYNAGKITKEQISRWLNAQGK